MIMTEAEKRAQNKYRRDKVKVITLRFYPADKELYDWCHDIGASGLKKLLQEIKEQNK